MKPGKCHLSFNRLPMYPILMDCEAGEEEKFLASVRTPASD
jgi:hypothetical protein